MKEILDFTNEDQTLSIKCGHLTWHGTSPYTMDLNGENHIIISKYTATFGGVQWDKDDTSFNPPLKKEGCPYFFMGIKSEGESYNVVFVFSDPYFIHCIGAYDENKNLIPEEEISDKIRGYYRHQMPTSPLLEKETLTVYDVMPSFKSYFDKIESLKLGDRIIADYLCSKGHTVLFKQ